MRRAYTKSPRKLATQRDSGKLAPGLKNTFSETKFPAPLPVFLTTPSGFLINSTGKANGD